MATQDLNPSSIIAATGWVGATVANLGASDDVRATGGTAGELIHAELGDAPGNFDSQNSISLNVEALVVGTVSRAKSILVELLNSADTVLQSFTTSSLTASDAVYSSSAFTRADALATINGYRIRATVQESGGMSDSATVEIDRLWATLDYAASGTPVAGADTLTPGLVDAGALQALLGRADSLTPAVADASALLALLTRDETLTPGLADTVQTQVLLAPPDTLTPARGMW